MPTITVSFHIPKEEATREFSLEYPEYTIYEVEKFKNLNLNPDDYFLELISSGKYQRGGHYLPKSKIDYEGYGITVSLKNYNKTKFIHND